jgi:hypothetical protein
LLREYLITPATINNPELNFKIEYMKSPEEAIQHLQRSKCVTCPSGYHGLKFKVIHSPDSAPVTLKMEKALLQQGAFSFVSTGTEHIVQSASNHTVTLHSKAQAVSSSPAGNQK